MFRLAAVQAAPVMFDAKATVERAGEWIAEAGRAGATLCAFGETFVPGYPRHVNAPITARERRRLTADYLDASIVIGGPETDRLCEAAGDAGCDVVIGIAEREPATAGSVYCTLLFISSEGRILGRHRKLKPTDGERTAWSDGDATGLRVHERAYARISGLNCWEHQMVLPGYALIAQGTQVHVAAYPGHEPASGTSNTRQLLLSRAFASQAGAYVVLTGGIVEPTNVVDPAMRAAVATQPSMNGGCHIIDPNGEIIAGPIDGEGLVIADASLDAVRLAKAMCDVGGHYARPDVFRFDVDRRERRTVTFTGDGE
jgi:nitrilase